MDDVVAHHSRRYPPRRGRVASSRPAAGRAHGRPARRRDDPLLRRPLLAVARARCCARFVAVVFNERLAARPALPRADARGALFTAAYVARVRARPRRSRRGRGSAFLARRLLVFRRYRFSSSRSSCRDSLARRARSRRSGARRGALRVRAALRRAWKLARADFVHAIGSLFTLAVLVCLRRRVLLFVLRGSATPGRRPRSPSRPSSSRRSSSSGRRCSTSTRPRVKVV